MPKVVETMATTTMVDSRNLRSRSLGLVLGSYNTSKIVKNAAITGINTAN